MKHSSIGIFCYSQPAAATREDELSTGPIDLYLVFNYEEKGCGFLEFTDNAINASFDHSRFRKKLIETVTPSLERKNEFIRKLEEIRLKFYMKSEKSPYNTAYKTQVDEKQYDNFSRLIKQDKDSIWAHASWISREVLLKRKEKWISSQLFLFEHALPFEEPKFSKKLRNQLRILSEAQKSKKLVIFAGAGISMESGLPSWGELCNHLLNDMDTPSQDPLEIAEEYRDVYGQKGLMEKLLKVLNHNEITSNPIHAKIIDLASSHIITTNYDNNFEHVIRAKGANLSVVCKDKDLPYSSKEALLIKMHGDLDNKNVVISTSDYDDYHKNFPLVRAYINSLFASKLVFFIGFSMEDPNLVRILEDVRDLLSDAHQKPFLFINEPKVFARNKNSKKIASLTHFVVYEEEPIQKYYDQITFADKIIHKISKRGQILYKFLVVLEQFDIATDSVENLTIEDQLIAGIKRFHPFAAVSPFVLSQISPFRLKTIKFTHDSDALYDSSNLRLKTYNEDLLNLFKNNLLHDEKYLNFKQLCKSNTQKGDPLNETLQIIYQSGIHSITRKNDFTESEVYSLHQTSNFCECSSCLASRFRYDHLLKNISKFENKNFEDINDLKYCIFYADEYLATGQIIKAYRLLTKIRTAAQQRNDHITNFLASYNTKYLRNLIWMDQNDQEDDIEFKKIEKDIDNIDLTSSHHMIHDKLVVEAVNYVYQEKYFIYADSHIKNKFQSIKENYMNSATGRILQFGSIHWQDIEHEFYGLVNFAISNNLFILRFKKFIDLAHIYVESMVASYSTHSKDKQKLKFFSSFFINILTYFTDPVDVNKIFDNHDLLYIETDSHRDNERVLQYFCNFCDSFYSKNSVFGNTIANSRVKNHLNYNKRFHDEVSITFQRLMLIIRRMKWNAKDIDTILMHFFGFIEISHAISSHAEFVDFFKLIDLNAEEISEKNIRRLIDFSISDKLWTEEIIPTLFSTILRNNKWHGLLPKEFLLKLKMRTASKSFTIRPIDLVPIYLLLHSDDKIAFFNWVRPFITNFDHYRSGLNWGLWNPKDNYELFSEFSELILKFCALYKEDIPADSDILIDFESRRIKNDLLYLVGVVYKFDLMDDQNVLRILDRIESKKFKWILDPLNFDYTIFKVEWLKEFCDELYTSKFKNCDPLMKVLIKRRNDSNLFDEFY